MAAYSRVYDSRHLQADCQEPGSAPEQGRGDGPKASTSWASEAARVKAELVLCHTVGLFCLNA